MRRATLGLVLALILAHISCTGTTKSSGGSDAARANRGQRYTHSGERARGRWATVHRDGHRDNESGGNLVREWSCRRKCDRRTNYERRPIHRSNYSDESKHDHRQRYVCRGRQREWRQRRDTVERDSCAQ